MMWIEWFLWVALYGLNLWLLNYMLRRQDALQEGLVIARDVAQKQHDILTSMEQQLTSYLENR